MSVFFTFWTDRPDSDHTQAISEFSFEEDLSLVVPIKNEIIDKTVIFIYFR